jgi:IclR family transcriptional regulator, acetate operon repressor
VGRQTSERPGMESVDRALRLLQALGGHGSGATLDDLATDTRLPKSSLHRTLSALRARGFATQHADGRYLLGSEVLRLAFDFYERLDVRVLVRPTLERLRRELNETVHLGVLDDADVVYVDKLEPSHPIALTSKIGGRNPAHSTAIGKALLAWTYPTQDAIEAWAMRSGPLVRRTPRTIVEPRALAREMARVRADGFSKDMEESEIGVRCVAAPVLLGSGPPVAAISVSAPKERLPPARLRDVVSVLRREAASASRGVNPVS